MDVEDEEDEERLASPEARAEQEQLEELLASHVDAEGERPEGEGGAEGGRAEALGLPEEQALDADPL